MNKKDTTDHRKKLEDFANGFHPGMMLKQLCEHRNISFSACARYLDVDPSTITRLVSGKKSMTPKIAIKIERAFGLDSLKLMRNQVIYDLALVDQDKYSHIKRLYEPGKEGVKTADELLMQYIPDPFARAQHFDYLDKSDRQILAKLAESTPDKDESDTDASA